MWSNFTDLGSAIIGGAAESFQTGPHPLPATFRTSGVPILGVHPRIGSGLFISSRY